MGRRLPPLVRPVRWVSLTLAGMLLVSTGAASAASSRERTAPVTAAPTTTSAAPATTPEAAGTGATTPEAAGTGQDRCAALNGLRVPAKRIGLPTTGAEITSTQPVAATAAAGARCTVLGAIHPVDPAAPDIRFRVELPMTWNQRSILLGGGGLNGVIPATDAPLPAGPADGASTGTPVSQGFVTYASDSGHQAGPATSRDGSFARNDDALVNFAGDALKKTHDVAQEIIDTRYGQRPQFRYVAGGSTGGREALLAVGRWPRDFEGAIVLYPAWNATALNLQFGAIARQLARPGAYPDPARRGALLRAVLQACDGLDGVRDGIVSDQAGCDARFDPATARVDGRPLACTGPADRERACLTPQQIRSFRTIDAPLRLPYRLASGQRGYPGFTTWGTDFGVDGRHPLQDTVVDLTLGLVAPASPMPPVRPVAQGGSPPYGSTFWDEWVRFFLTRNPTFDSLSLDPHDPGRWQRRIVELGRLQDANATDLGAFARRGGKILVAHGVHDGLVSNRATRQWLSRLRADMGPAAVREFVRYYEIPGYGHAVSTTFNAEWDSLPALRSWVEQGRAPGPQVVADRAGVPSGRTRPLCEFPRWPRFVAGDPDAAKSFRCVER